MSAIITRRRWLTRVGLGFAAFVGIGIIILVIVAGTSPPSVAEGEFQLQKGQIDKARQVARERVARDPSDGAAWHLLGRCEESESHFSGAVEAYRQAIQHLSSNWKSRERYAFSLLAMGRLEDAEHEFQKLHAEQPNNDFVRTELQWLLFNQLREREVEQLLEASLSREPGNFDLAYHLVYASQRRPIAQELVGLLRRANEEVPGQASVELALGRCYWQLGDPVRARVLLQSAHRQLKNLECSLVLAEFLLEQGEGAEADAVLKAPATGEGDIWRQDDRWWWGQCQRAIEQKKLEDAFSAITQALRLRPGELRYVQVEATLLQALHRADDALAARERAKRLAQAERELFIIVSRDDLKHPTPEICKQVARLCLELGKPIQARAWENLAANAVRQSVPR